MIEILILNLRPGTRDEFHQLYINESLPLQQKWNIDVVAHGPSLHDDNSYYVIRSFKGVDERQRQVDAFYNSNDWQKGPRTAILAKIENMATAVIPKEAIQEWLSSINKEA
jgi:hypothetical protein